MSRPKFFFSALSRAKRRSRFLFALHEGLISLRVCVAWFMVQLALKGCAFLVNVTHVCFLPASVRVHMGVYIVYFCPSTFTP